MVAPFTTPEILDVTEVEKTKLHEAGETERHKLSESAETKRRGLNFLERLTDSGNTGFYFAVILVPIVAVVAAAIVIGGIVSSKYPSAPVACSDSFNVVTAASDKEHCTPGATLETTPMAGTDKIQVRCTCKKP